MYTYIQWLNQSSIEKKKNDNNKNHFFGLLKTTLANTTLAIVKYVSSTLAIVTYVSSMFY